MSDKSACFAEIVESCLTYYRAQSWDYACTPAHGSLVVAEQDGLVIYALVYHSQMGTDDSVRTVHAYQKTQEELKRDQPQIFALLKTQFSVFVVGHERDNKLYYRCAPVPASLHAFVRHATLDEWRVFAQTVNYIPLLFGQQNLFNTDELLLALVGSLKQKKLAEEAFLVELLGMCMGLCDNDYRRVRFLAQRFEQV